jgi:hypothetical protein
LLLSLFNPYVNLPSQSSHQLLPLLLHYYYYCCIVVVVLLLSIIYTIIGLFITSTLLHLGEDINLLVVSQNRRNTGSG